MKKHKIDHLKEHFQSGRSITQLEAIGLYSMFRLAARVLELKQKGWLITTNMKSDPKGTQYAEYVFEGMRDRNPHGLPEFALPDLKDDEVPVAVRGDYWRA